MSSRHDYDTIIIGGGPGGSTAGAFLARAGQQVLVLEKEFFPRFHIGESMLPFGNDVLKASGVWPKVEAAGFMPKLGGEFLIGNSSLCQRFWFAQGLIPGYGQTFQVERSKFDDVLLKHAADCGCEVRQGCAAKSVASEDGGVSVTLADGQTLRARWLVDASGRDTFIGRALNLPRANLCVPKRIAVFAHFTGGMRNEGDAVGHTTVVRLKDGWFWLIPLDEHKSSVGMVRTADDLKESGGNVEAWFEQTVAGSTELAKRMNGTKRVSELYTTTDYTYRYQVLAQERMLMVGDAGGFFDPIFSSGILIATKSAQLAAERILRVDPQCRGLTVREQRQYTAAVHRLMNIYFKLILIYYNNASFEVFMRPQDRFRLVQTINSLLAGNTTMSFSMWWRIQLFHLVCRLQRRVPVVPRLDFTDRLATSPAGS